MGLMDEQAGCAALACSCPEEITAALSNQGCAIKHQTNGVDAAKGRSDYEGLAQARVPGEADAPSVCQDRQDRAQAGQRWVNGCTRGDRSVVATRSFAAGDVVWREEPYAYCGLPSDITGLDRCGVCLVSSGAMMRCGGCKTVRYCSKACQAKDWREQHKAECRGVLEAVQQHNLAPEALIDLILVGRTLRRRHAALDTAKVSQSKGKALSASHAVLDAMKGCTPLADDGSEETSGDATLARLVVQSGLAHEGATVQDVRRLLAVFQCNNFGISTELLKPVASGVFPFTALLNHCCDPSCVLTYDPDLPTRVVVRACRPISAGDELTHSYIDVAATSTARRQRLAQTYHFRCTCVPCETGSAGTPSAPIPDAQLSEVRVDVKGDAAGLIRKAEALKRQAAEHTDLEKERACVEAAVEIERSVLAPLNTNLFATSQLAFSLATAVGDYEAAVRHGKHILACLQRYYHSNHPQTGLHMHVLADIYAELARSTERDSVASAESYREAATELWAQAISVLAVTHGKSHPLVAAHRTGA